MTFGIIGIILAVVAIVAVRSGADETIVFDARDGDDDWQSMSNRDMFDDSDDDSSVFNRSLFGDDDDMTTNPIYSHLPCNIWYSSEEAISIGSDDDWSSSDTSSSMFDYSSTSDMFSDDSSSIGSDDFGTSIGCSFDDDFGSCSSFDDSFGCGSSWDD